MCVCLDQLLTEITHYCLVLGCHHFAFERPIFSERGTYFSRTLKSRSTQSNRRGTNFHNWYGKIPRESFSFTSMNIQELSTSGIRTQVGLKGSLDHLATKVKKTIKFQSSTYGLGASALNQCARDVGQKPDHSYLLCQQPPRTHT